MGRDKGKKKEIEAANLALFIRDRRNTDTKVVLGDNGSKWRTTG